MGITIKKFQQMSDFSFTLHLIMAEVIVNMPADTATRYILFSLVLSMDLRVNSKIFHEINKEFNILLY